MGELTHLILSDLFLMQLYSILTRVSSFSEVDGRGKGCLSAVLTLGRSEGGGRGGGGGGGGGGVASQH